MADINSVVLCGRLGQDPELRRTSDGTPVCNMRIAVNGMRKDEVSWFSVVAFQKTAELCAQYLAKGRQVNIAGRLQERRWVAQDGANRTSIEVVANTVQFLGGPAEGERTPTRPRNDLPADEPFPQPTPEGVRTGDQDIPF